MTVCALEDPELITFRDLGIHFPAFASLLHVTRPLLPSNVPTPLPPPSVGREKEDVQERSH